MRNLVAFHTKILHVLMGLLQLPRDMVDVAFQRHNFLNIVLLFLLKLGQSETSSADILLRARNLVVKVFVLLTDLLDRVLKPLVLLTGIAVVLQNVFLLDFQGPSNLLSFALLINESVVLTLQQLVGMRRLAKLLVHKPIFSGQSLDILRYLSDFLCLQLGQLGLLLQVLAEREVVRLQVLDLGFTLEKATLVVVFFAVTDRHLVLDI